MHAASKHGNTEHIESKILEFDSNLGAFVFLTLNE